MFSVRMEAIKEKGSESDDEIYIPKFESQGKSGSFLCIPARNAIRDKIPGKKSNI